MINDKGYIHITHGLLDKLKFENSEAYFSLIKEIQDFFEWGGDVFLSHYKACEVDIKSENFWACLEEYCKDESACIGMTVSDLNKGYIFNIWDATEYLKHLYNDKTKKERFINSLCVFVNNGGIVKINDKFCFDDIDLDQVLRNII